MMHTHTHTHIHTAAPVLPKGKELSSSSMKTSTVGLFSHLPSPDMGSIQVSDNDSEERKKERNEPRDSQIPILSGSESSGVKGHGIHIQVVDEDDEEEEINEDTDVVLRRGRGDDILERLHYKL